MAIESSFGEYRFGAAEALSAEQCQRLLHLVEHGRPMASGILGGRRAVAHEDVPGFGKLVVKRYVRGGVTGRIVKDSHLRLSGGGRSQTEYERILQVRNFGVTAPEPIAFIIRGGCVYHAWLITREFENSKTLAQLCTTEEELVRAVLAPLVEQIEILIAHRIFHVDLHPGNVLVRTERSERPHIAAFALVDFDKACDFICSERQLRDRYLIRWRRAVIKHGLPDYLSEQIALGLRRRDLASSALALGPRIEKLPEA